MSGNASGKSAGRKKTSETKEQAEERRRRERRERIFGEVLPESTSDDRDEDPDERTKSQDSWLRSQVPPHHG